MAQNNFDLLSSLADAMTDPESFLRNLGSGAKQYGQQLQQVPSLIQQGVVPPVLPHQFQYPSELTNTNPQGQRFMGDQALAERNGAGISDLGNLASVIVGATNPIGGQLISAVTQAMQPSLEQTVQDNSPITSEAIQQRPTLNNGLMDMSQTELNGVFKDVQGRLERRDPVGTGIRNGLDWFFNNATTGNQSVDYPVHVVNQVLGSLGILNAPDKYTGQFGADKGIPLENYGGSDYFQTKIDDFKKNPIQYFQDAAAMQDKVSTLRDDLLSQTNYTPAMMQVAKSIPIIVNPQSKGATYNPDNNEITLGGDVISQSFSQGKLPVTSLHVLRHELDHAVDANINGKFSTPLSNSKGFAQSLLSDYSQSNPMTQSPYLQLFKNNLAGQGITSQGIHVDPNDQWIKNQADSEMFAEYGANGPNAVMTGDPNLALRYKNMFQTGDKMAGYPPQYPSDELLKLLQNKK